MYRISLMSLLFAIANPAFAYIGPGAGISLLGALWGLIAALIAALGFVLFWPLRRLRRRRRLARDAEAKVTAAAPVARSHRHGAPDR